MPFLVTSRLITNLIAKNRRLSAVISGSSGGTSDNPEPGRVKLSVMRGFLAHHNFKQDLFDELGAQPDDLWLGPLCLKQKLAKRSIWAQQEWLKPELIEIRSINHAADELRDRGRNWAALSYQHHRRTQLIVDKLPKLKRKEISFLEARPAAKMGAFVLESKNRLWVSAETNHPYPLGEVNFKEDRVGPPSRAYLKLWELFTIYLPPPTQKDFCLDLGASPGGWSWVLNNLGAQVLAVDRSPMEDSLMKKVRFNQASAFSIRPEDFDQIDWLFSDLICYPQKLFEMVQRWLDSGRVRNMVCTIKFQGPTDFAIVRRFLAIPGSWARHLFHNKHEVTWVWQAHPHHLHFRLTL